MIVKTLRRQQQDPLEQHSRLAKPPRTRIRADSAANPRIVQESLSEEALEPDAATSANAESPATLTLPSLPPSDSAIVVKEDAIDDDSQLPFSGCFTAAADKYQPRSVANGYRHC